MRLTSLSIPALLLSAAFAPAQTPPIRVNAGGPAYTDSLSQSWSADTGYQGGATYSTTASIANTSDPTLYQTLRYSPSGNLVYQFNVPNGVYLVRLKFAELYYTSAGQRVFPASASSTSHSMARPPNPTSISSPPLAPPTALSTSPTRQPSSPAR